MYLFTTLVLTYGLLFVHVSEVSCKPAGPESNSVQETESSASSEGTPAPAPYVNKFANTSVELKKATIRDTLESVTALRDKYPRTGPAKPRDDEIPVFERPADGGMALFGALSKPNSIPQNYSGNMETQIKDLLGVDDSKQVKTDDSKQAKTDDSKQVTADDSKQVKADDSKQVTS